MTQYLWQGNSTVSNALAHVKDNIPERFGQTPRADVKVGSGYESKSLYFIDASQPPAQAVITEVNGGKVKLWLGGVGTKSLAGADNGAVLLATDASGHEVGKVTLQSREGLVGEGTVTGNVERGTLLQLVPESSPGI